MTAVVTGPRDGIDARADGDVPHGDRPRVIGVLPAYDIFALLGAMASALGLVWLLYERILPTAGILGFWICWYFAFLFLYALIIGQVYDRLTVVDKVMSAILLSAALVMLAALVTVITYTVFRGVRALHWNFFTQTMALTGPLAPLNQGGAWHAIVGSLEQVGIAVLLTVPLGISTALFLNEVNTPLAKPVRLVVDAMSALPSIVAGLFIFATVVLSLGYNRCGLAAALAIGVMMLPIITRTAEVVFRLVPSGLREASYALGASQWKTAWNVVLPTARTGLVTAVILGIARGVGETAPVLLTAGFTAEYNADPTKGPQVSLPLYILNYVRLPQADNIARAYGAALVLLFIVTVLFVTARILGGRGPGHLSRRQRRRIEAETSIARNS